MHRHRQFAAIVAAWLGVCASVAAAQTPPPPDDSPRPAPRIALDDFRRLNAAGRVLTIDVRDAHAFATGHIPGAINVPLDQIERRAGEIRTRANRREIVTYCACPDEHTSAQAALTLIARGIDRVSALVGGLRAWLAAGGRLQV
jgi:rhodanese-related sulfurtransferase